jgi:hypothetical protein
VYQPFRPRPNSRRTTLPLRLTIPRIINSHGLA